MTFAALLALRGQAGESPGLLALVTILQFMEGLTDRQAAEAVRSRIDWKYLLGLALTDPGFHYSILSPFRDRLLVGGQEAQLFDRVLERIRERGLLSNKRVHRTDSTHVLAAVRQLNHRHSQSWYTRREKYGHEYIAARFAPADCLVCAQQSDCTKSKRGVRTATFKPRLEYETLQAARERQETTAFKDKYNKRAGIEGTISQGARAFNLRRSRYLGLAKTHLQHLATAAAMNLTRVVHWLRKTGRSNRPPIVLHSPLWLQLDVRMPNKVL